MGEENSAPLEYLENYRQKLREITSTYELCNIFNADEIALFWRMGTLSARPVSGTKKFKERITVYLTCNATGEEKFSPLFIHKFEINQVYQFGITGLKKRGCKAPSLTIILTQNKFMQRQKRNIL